ncbi:arginase family protein [Streptomyces sp. NBC_00868]|uniref:arginase family protein n=1 Tax=Streptomyces sp. NBC_00868 TaxID=2903683 RepID=UPI00386EB23B
MPLCLNQDDLRGGDVDVAVLGAPVDMGLGHRGAAYGPRALRGDERILPNVPQGLVNPSTRIRSFGELTVVDDGDAADHSILWPDAGLPSERVRRLVGPCRVMFRVPGSWEALGGYGRTVKLHARTANTHSLGRKWQK